MPKSKHPMQPITLDPHGVARFKENAIVRYLIDLTRDAGICDMNKLALLPFKDEDRRQFAQLIGYSVGGYSDLFPQHKSVDKADRKVAKLIATKGA